MSDLDKNNRLFKNKYIYIILFSCIFLFSIGLFATNYYSKNPHEFGDSAGVVNAFFSALAFAGIIYTIYLQTKELALQRKELELTRDEMKGQKEEFITQNQTLKRQQFENSFFQMLNLQQDILKDITCYNKEQYTIKKGVFLALSLDREFGENIRIMSGREVFYFLYEGPRNDSAGPILQGLKKTFKEKGIQDIDNIFIRFDQFSFLHYFKHLFNIIEYVDQTDFLTQVNKAKELEDRQFYVNIIKSQLSDYEVIWIYYCGLTQIGKEKYKPLIEKYSMLNGLRTNLLADPNSEYRFYEPSAFQ